MARVLIIDDNPEMLAMLEVILQHQGNHEVYKSTSGEEGLQLAQENVPDVAVVDVMMPGMNGYEVVKKLRAHPKTSDVHILVLTARGQPVDRLAALQAGANHYMSKPVDASELLAEIEQLTQNEKGVTHSAVFPVLSLRGGIGTTTIAVNLALLLQQVSRTALLDLSPNSGHCALYLGMKARRNWSALLDPEAINDATTIGGLTLKHASGLRLLAAPMLPLQDEGFTQNQASMLLQVFQKYLRFVVVDMPPMLTPTAMALLREARRILLVSGNDSPGIQTTRQTMAALDAYREKITLVINNVTPGSHPPNDVLRRALQAPITAQIPYDSRQTTVKNTGAPVVLSQPRSPMVQALQRVTRSLLK
jgi:pilus assembly protein CpaE